MTKSTQSKPRLLINLPPGFFKTPELRPVFRRLGSLATLRKRSYNTPEEIDKDLAWADAVVMWSWPMLDAALLDKALQLKFAGHINIGLEGALAELSRGMAVSEARGGWSPAVAEMALTLILAGLRRTSTFHSAMWNAKEPWVKDIPFDVDPLERQLTGRNVGIVGFGGIGQRLAELLRPFDVSLHTYDPYIPAAILKRHNAKRVSLMELAKRSEVLVLCAANTAETDNLIGEKVIAALPTNALLVNVGRASLVDMSALTQRLKQGDLFACLDVFEQEPLPKNSPLRRLPNLYMTPHRAGGLTESVVRIMDWLADDYEAFLKGKPRKHALRKEMFKSLS